MINPDLLKSFVAAADTGSFSAAGRLLGRQQSTISSNISRLEDILGVVLFSRSGKYPQLSEAGAALYDSAKQAVESTERFANNASLLSAGEPISITIGLDEDLPIGPLQLLLREIRSAYPHLQLIILRESGTRLIELIKNDSIELALIPTLESSSNFYEFRIAGLVELVIVCGKQHKFASKRTISNDDLMQTTQVVPNSSNDSLYAINQMSPDRWACQGYEALLEAVRADIGWAMLPLFPGDDLPQGLTRINPEFAMKNLAMQYELLWQKNSAQSEVERFIMDRLITLLSA
ncbi:MAG: LysR family transcriptional regulator [Amphritea sp.]